LCAAEEKRKQEFFKARGLLKEQKEGIHRVIPQLLACVIHAPDLLTAEEADWKISQMQMFIIEC